MKKITVVALSLLCIQANAGVDSHLEATEHFRLFNKLAACSALINVSSHNIDTHDLDVAAAEHYLEARGYVLTPGGGGGKDLMLLAAGIAVGERKSEIVEVYKNDNDQNDINIDEHLSDSECNNLYALTKGSVLEWVTQP